MRNTEENLNERANLMDRPGAPQRSYNSFYDVSLMEDQTSEVMSQTSDGAKSYRESRSIITGTAASLFHWGTNN